jgi:hypothetical protein
MPKMDYTSIVTTPNKEGEREKKNRKMKKKKKKKKKGPHSN